MSRAEQDFERVKQACEVLSEHFDTVQIFTTRYQSEGEAAATDDYEGTVNVNCGSGNWFARIGQIKNWILKEEEHSKEEVRNKDD